MDQQGNDSVNQLQVEFRSASQRIVEPQPGEAGKIPVAGRKRGSVFDGEGCQVGVHHQRPWRLPFQEKVTQDLPVPLAGTEESDHRPIQPFRNNGHGFKDGKRTRERARVCTDAQETQNSHPREANRFRLR